MVFAIASEAPLPQRSASMSEPIQKIPREREVSPCPCNRKLSYADCCMRFHYGRAKPETAEELMRSRYSAYFFRLLDYLLETTHPDTRTIELAREVEDTLDQPLWRKLTILSTSKGTRDDNRGKVRFSAKYKVGADAYELEEHSRFKRYKGAWKYLDDKG